MGFVEPPSRVARHAALFGREQPRNVRLIPQSAAPASFNEKISLPEGIDLLWARLDIEKTPMGRVCELLFKMPILHIALEFENGTKSRHRIVPRAAQSGFLLSPLIDSARRFARLWPSPTPGKRAWPNRVASIAIVGSAWARSLYQNPFRVELSRVVIEGASGRR